MAFWFGDSFDLYTASGDALTNGSYWDGSSGTNWTLVAGRFAGSQGTNWANSFLNKTSGSNDAVHHFNLAIAPVTISAGNTSADTYINLNDGATTQCSVAFRRDGTVVLTTAASGGGTVLATSPQLQPVAGVWNAFEVEVVINNTTGSIAVRKNGNTVNDYSATGLNTRQGTTNAYANNIRIGGTGGNVDDFLWRSDAASVSWAGDIRCYARMPASDASVAWSRSGSAVPVTPAPVGTNTNSLNTAARFTPFTAPVSGSIGTLVLQTGAGNTGNIKCSLFADNGSNAPGAVLGSATPLNNTPSGNNTFTFGTPVAVTAGTKYWAGFMTDTSVTLGWTYTTLSNSVTQSGTTYAAFPTANPGTVGSQNGLYCTINIGVSTNSAMVSDPQQDGAASYVYSSTVGQADLYGLGSLSATPGSIIGVTTRILAEKSDAGTRTVSGQLKSGSTTVSTTATALNTTWGWIYRTDLTDPATGAAWTATGVNNAQIGATVTA